MAHMLLEPSSLFLTVRGCVSVGRIRELCMLLAIEKPEAQQLRERLYLQTESARATILAQLQPKPILSLSGREAERALQLRGDLVPPSS